MREWKLWERQLPENCRNGKRRNENAGRRRETGKKREILTSFTATSQ